MMDELISGAVHDPHATLGAHPHAGSTTIRTLRRDAAEVTIVVGDDGYPAARVHPEGIFEVTVPGEVLDYRVDVDGRVQDDPYRFGPTIGEIDLHLINEGRHEKLWEALGAHVRDDGVSFTVWAPSAQGVRVIGDFAGWGPHDGWPMRSMGSSGVWEIFVPHAGVGNHYKYRILGRDGVWREKADPMARRTEIPPRTASVVDESAYDWKDAEWMTRRVSAKPHQEAMSVYEVHLGSWRPGLGYRDLADQLTEYVVEMGFTHVEFLPVMEHPFGGSWGYQVTGYYAPTARFGDPDDFRYLVDRLHQSGIGVLLDWVPAHFPRDEWALARFDGTPLYEHGDWRRGEHPDWGTYIFDYGRREVRNFLVANALYWCAEFHVDGLRVDAVASMLYLDYSRQDGQWEPNQYGGRENLDAIEFLQETNATVYKHHPGVVMIAEESTAYPGVTWPTSGGGLGFGFKWNMGWMHDTLLYASKEPMHRQYHHNQVTFSMVYAWSENYVLPICARRGRTREAVVALEDARRSVAAPGQRAGLAGLHVGASRQAAAVHGVRAGDDEEWNEERGLNWGWLRIRNGRGSSGWSGTSTPSTSRRLSCGRRTRRRPGSGGSCPTTPPTTRWRSSGWRRTGRRWCAWSTSRPSRTRTTGSGCRGPAPGPRCSTRTRATTAARVSATSARWCTEEVHWHGMPASARLRVPPLGALWLRPA